jgi:hypothetical protein
MIAPAPYEYWYFRRPGETAEFVSQPSQTVPEAEISNPVPIVLHLQRRHTTKE